MAGVLPTCTFFNSHSSTHLTVDKIISDGVYNSRFVCVQILWYSFDDLFIDAIILSATLLKCPWMFFGRIICKLYFFFANSLAYIDKKLFESKQTRHCKKKKLHKDTHICQFWPSFVYLMAASHSFLCANAICLIVCVFAFAVYFFFFGDRFWLLFLIWLSGVIQFLHYRFNLSFHYVHIQIHKHNFAPTKPMVSFGFYCCCCCCYFCCDLYEMIFFFVYAFDFSFKCKFLHT